MLKHLTQFQSELNSLYNARVKNSLSNLSILPVLPIDTSDSIQLKRYLSDNAVAMQHLEAQLNRLEQIQMELLEKVGTEE